MTITGGTLRCVLRFAELYNSEIAAIANQAKQPVLSTLLLVSFAMYLLFYRTLCFDIVAQVGPRMSIKNNELHKPIHVAS